MISLPRATAVLALFAAVQALAQPLPKVTIAASALRSMKSTSTGRDYDLYIHLPANYDRDANAKYPALYILDGQWDFKLMDSVLGGLFYDKFVPEMILVGITYSGENANYDGLRAIDYTPGPRQSGSGGAPDFLKFLKTELIPFIEKTYRADPQRRAIQGSSFGGLFTLYALFEDPGLFSRYLAASPSVPFANNFTLKQEAEYFSTHKELNARLYLAVGSDEGLAGPVKDFMKVLQSRAYKGLKLETKVAEGERHASNKPEVYNRGLRFLFSD